MMPPSFDFAAGADEGRGQDLLAGRVGQLVAGQLPGDELVVGDVALEGRDHPVAVGVLEAPLAVVQVAVESA